MEHALRSAVSYGGMKARRYSPPSSVRSVSAADFARLLGPDTTPEQVDLLGVQAARRPGTEIYLAGDTGLLARRCVSIIGARKCSPEGAARARRLARELVAHDVIIVSGLAEGIDTAAMTAAMEAGGHTIGVIGTPLDRAYPAANAELQADVYRRHLLVSRFEPGSRVFPSNFPERNRLMAMMSSATVVIEASDTSGTLHQAAECARLGRWLFIAQSVVSDSRLTWPAKFLSNPKFRVLTQTEDLLATVFP
jgi:DNA processing protein